MAVDAFDSFLRDLEWVKVDKISSDSGSEKERKIPDCQSLITNRRQDGLGCEKLQVDNTVGIAAATDNQTFLFRDRYINGAGRWFLNSPPFKSWVGGYISPHLWVRGLPGSGKSVIAASVIAALHQLDAGICGYFFCSDRELSKRSASEIIRTIICQISQHSPDVTKHLDVIRQDGVYFTLSPSTLWQRVMVGRINPMSPRIYIVLDGIDECDQKERRILLDIISLNKRNANISWLVFSRFLPDIAQSLDGPNMVLKPTDSAQDIRSYTAELIERSPSLRSLSMKEGIAKKISASARGLFLSVKFIIQLLDNEEIISGIFDAGHLLPSGIEGIYDAITKSLDLRLSADEARLISAAFGWIGCASRPLTVIEMLEAVSLSHERRGLDVESTLQKHCRSLITVSSSNVVGFIHRTFEEYLASQRCPVSLAVIYREAHTKASSVCLSYLSNISIRLQLSSAQVQKLDMTSVNYQYPLLTYSALFWPEHIDYAKAELNSDLMGQLSEFISSKNLLIAVEVALTVAGIESLHRWMTAFSNFNRGLQNTSAYENVKRFIFDFRRLVNNYGYILDKCPSNIYTLIDDTFPRNSHFWQYFRHPKLSVTNQIEEWDPLVATLQQRHITCSTVNGWFLAAADPHGVSVWDLRLNVEISQISDLPSLVVALAFSDDSLAVFCQDGSLRIVATQSWIIKRTLDTVLTLPSVVKNWSSAQFWNNDYIEFDPVHVNLGFVGKGILASNWLVNLENGKAQLVPHSTLSPSTISQLACTKGRDLVMFTANWDAASRKLGSPNSVLRRFKTINESQGTEWLTKRLLAVSTTGRFVATCRVTIRDGYSKSENMFECLCRDLDASVLIEQFADGDKITAAAFSEDESMLSVSSHNGERHADTTRLWTLKGQPQLIWEKTLYDDYTTSLSFGLEDTVLIKAGRSLLIWDVSEWMRRSTIRERTNLRGQVERITPPTIKRKLSFKLLANDQGLASSETLCGTESQKIIISRIGTKLWGWRVHMLRPRHKIGGLG